MKAVAYLGFEHTEDLLHALRHHVLSREGRLIGLFAEKGNMTLSRRPALFAAISQIAKEQANFFILPRISELKLPPKDLASVFGELLKAKASIHFLDEDLDLKPSDISTFYLLLKNAVDCKTAVQSEKIKKSLNARRRGGFILGCPPFGKSEKGKQVLQEIVQMRRSGFTLRQICETLNRFGAKSAQAKQWHPSTIKRLLDRMTVDPRFGSMPS